MWRLGSISGIVGAGLLACVLAGCEGDTQPGGGSKSAAPLSAATQPTAGELANVRQFVEKSAGPPGQGLPAGHPPIGNPPGAPAAGVAPASEATSAALKYKAPEGWQREEVAPNPVVPREAQFRLPRAEGDPADGELAVFSRGIGGTVDDNILRWRLQFSTADDKPIPNDACKRESREVHGLKVTLVDISGRFNAGMGGGSPMPKDNWRVLGAIVETPSGLWFFKALGPNATMAKHRDAFLALIDSLTTQ